jgi:hypothetical protein
MLPRKVGRIENDAARNTIELNERCGRGELVDRGQ